MRQHFHAHYCNSVQPCKHIRLTVITAWMLLLVGCSTEKAPFQEPAGQVKAAPVPQRQDTPVAEKSIVPPEKFAGKPGEWHSLFDGSTLKGWKITDFAGHGDVRVEEGAIVLDQGVMTGVNWTSAIPTMNYEIALDAKRVEGSDFFCGLTFPVGTNPCSFIVGGWGGGVVGISSLDGEDAANNETTKVAEFEKNRWYAVKVRVEPKKIQAWIDNEKYVDVDTSERRIGIRPEVELSRPLGISSWSTTAALRNIRVRQLNPPSQ